MLNLVAIKKWSRSQSSKYEQKRYGMTIVNHYKPLLFSQGKLSKAQKNKNYLEKLKTTKKYDDYKKRKADEQRARRQRKKEQEDELSQAKLNEMVLARRMADRERQQRSRAKKKMNGRKHQSTSQSVHTIPMPHLVKR